MKEDNKCISHCDENHNHEEHNHEGHNHGYEINTKIYIIRILLSLTITAVTYFLDFDGIILISFLLVAYILVGYEVLFQAIKNIIRGEVFDENFLMGFASLGAFIIGERLEAIAVLVFYAVGEMLQDMAVDKSKKNISKLMDIRPDYANLEEEGKVSKVKPDDVNVGDIILIKAGERVPLDGIVISGNSFIDTKALTGETKLVSVSKGSQVLSGSINENAVIRLEVTKNFSNSTVSKILELVQNASSKKAKSEQFITKFARYYTPIVVFMALCVGILPVLLGFGTFKIWIYRALSFLIISCPCALVISIPLSFFGGIGGSAKHGILVKGGNYLDAINEIDVVVFDKTGTLTKGVFEISEIVAVDGIRQEELLELAAIGQSKSTHPIAKSIMKYYDKKPILADEIVEKAGQGIVARYDNVTILIGNDKLMKENNIKYTNAKRSGSIVHIGKNSEYLGYILLSDKVRDEAAKVIKESYKYGIKETVMLTGDIKEKANEIGKLVGVDKVYAELLPKDKVKIFNEIKNNNISKGKVAFIGDGINDAPVLANADIGISMGAIGSDAAIEAADVVFMKDDLTNIITAKKIARKTRKIVLQNIGFALGVKILIMILALLDISSIWFAIFADVGVALLALINATRAMKVR